MAVIPEYSSTRYSIEYSSGKLLDSAALPATPAINHITHLVMFRVLELLKKSSDFVSELDYIKIS